MSAIRTSSVAAARGRDPLIAAILAIALVGAPASMAAAGEANLQAVYNISIAGLTVGRAKVDGSFSDTSYSAAIEGATRGIIRLVSDSQATLAGSGRIHGSHVIPAVYKLTADEDGSEAHVDMAMSGGSIVAVEADPPLRNVPDRIPVTPAHKRRVVDPIGAFVVALGNSSPADGDQICDRTVPVFDGWQRYNVRLFYKDTRTVVGHDGSYSGDVIVCGARYVPIAGHRPGRGTVQYMADNKRLEVWLVPVENTGLYLPYRVLVGTQFGDLVVRAKKFVVTTSEQHASAN